MPGSSIDTTIKSNREKTIKMIFTAAIAFTSTLGLMATPVAAGNRMQMQKSSFIREMEAATANKKIPNTKTSSLNSPTLRKKVMEKATPLPAGGRKLQNNQNANQANANNAQSQNDGADDYFMAFGEWNNAFGFDPTQYSLSYHRCAEVRQFDDELAAQEDSTSVFATKHFAVFRFCPSETCGGLKEQEEELNWWNRTYGKWVEEQQEEAEQQQEEYENQKYQYEYGEEPPLIGARGEGCSSNYGEYMIELTDYLELMAEFREERFDAYCEYCAKCIYNMYKQWLNSQGRARDLKEYDDMTWKDDIDALENDFSWNAHRALGGCPGIDSCWSYKNICGGGASGDFVDYFECTEVERNNGQSVYVGPHCAKDGFTINLGVYGDQYCNEYIGNGVDIQNVLGQKLEQNYLLEYVSGTVEKINQIHLDFPEFGFCIPCSEANQPYGIGDDDASDDYLSGNGQVIELCQNMYQASARCDKHYRSWSNKAKQSKVLAAKMDFQCDFIDSVVTGNYDEMGFVRLDQESVTNPSGFAGLIEKTFSFRTTNGMAPEEKVTPMQIFGLCASLFACAVLGLWAATLQGKKIAVPKGWRVRRAAAGHEIQRTDSGIMMGRSDSYISPDH